MSLNPISFGYGLLKSIIYLVFSPKFIGTQSLCNSVVTAFVDSGDKIVQNIQNGIFLTFIQDTEPKNNIITPDTSFESSDQTKFYQSLFHSQRQESMDSIIGSVSNLVHAIFLFPFSQPITPYVMSKRKKSVKRNSKATLDAKRPLRYITGSRGLEAYDDVRSKIQVNHVT